MVLLLDLDGTIIGTKNKKSDIMTQTAKELGIPPVDRKEYMNTFHKFIDEGKIDDRTPIFKKLLDDDESAEKLSREYQKTLLYQLYVFPDAKELLEELDGTKGLVTNGPRLVQREKLNYFDLEKYFDAIAISGEVGAAKPKPHIFHHILNELSAEPSESFYVGNSESLDVEGAKNAGVTPILVNRNPDPDDPPESDPDYVVEDLREVLEII
ncbi:MAG: HAD family hydrolase [Hadesarchaea archaeon]|nr:HAD family hydrolase [Hadesarchaea archaeon]